MKFWYIDVMERVKSQTSDKLISKSISGPDGSKKCMSVQEANEHLKAMKEKYPAPQYQVYRESR